MTKTRLTTDLPEVGDLLWRIPTADNVDPDLSYKPEPCVVIYVNKAHRWYEVKFLLTSLRECYNLPVFDHYILKDFTCRSKPLVCLETGEIFRTATDCATVMGLSRTSLHNHVNGKPGHSHCGGYHFIDIFKGGYI